MERENTRRRFLELVGAGSVVALAGCTSSGNVDPSTTPPETTRDGTTPASEPTTRTTPDPTTEPPKGMSTVFHFSGDPAHQKHAVANVRNLLADDSTSVENVALVANGGGIRLVVADASEQAEAVAAVAAQGVEVLACHNSMDAFNYTESDLVEGVETVPAGVGELTKRQAAGYAYIKTP